MMSTTNYKGIAVSVNGTLYHVSNTTVKGNPDCTVYTCANVNGEFVEKHYYGIATDNHGVIINAKPFLRNVRRDLVKIYIERHKADEEKPAVNTLTINDEFLSRIEHLGFLIGQNRGHKVIYGKGRGRLLTLAKDTKQIDICMWVDEQLKIEKQKKDLERIAKEKAEINEFFRKWETA